MQWYEFIYVDAPKGQERVLHLLEFKSQAVLDAMCILGTESGLVEEQQMPLLAGPSLQPYISVLRSISIVLWIPAQVL